MVGLAVEEGRRLVRTIERLAGSDVEELVFSRGGPPTRRRKHLIQRLVREIVAAVRASERRTPWELSVQTGEDATSRTFVMDRFQTPGNPFFLVLTNVGTFGVDLHPYCWDIVHYTPEWTPHAAEQKAGRIDRSRSRYTVARLDIGSKSRLGQIRVHHLIWPFTYDERILVA